ncbi:protein of unknown function [Nitrospira japonica]|uniref:Uncharacterized protein n=1 Tax=Nitrospira japonica TaxID=1325564 RepID=A0A1W1I265_9BACT|nr:protein of unknown function [Nitrospira japonica]
MTLVIPRVADLTAVLLTAPLNILQAVSEAMRSDVRKIQPRVSASAIGYQL